MIIVPEDIRHFEDQVFRKVTSPTIEIPSQYPA